MFNIIERKYSDTKSSNLKNEKDKTLLFKSEDEAINFLRNIIKGRDGEKLKFDSDGTIIRYMDNFYGKTILYYYNIDFVCYIVKEEDILNDGKSKNGD